VKDKNTLRIIDANLNRFREALRVCEDVARFSIEDKAATARFKTLRHDVARAISGSKKVKYPSLVLSRDSVRDIGKFTTGSELARSGPLDILGANLQRAKESVRVLEEFTKIMDRELALKFKDIRFKVYNTEKALIEELGSVRNTRQGYRRR